MPFIILLARRTAQFAWLVSAESTSRSRYCDVLARDYWMPDILGPRWIIGHHHATGAAR